MRAAEAVPTALITLAHRLAEASGAAIRPYFRALDGVMLKADTTPVTVADQAAEQVIREILAQERPTDGIWGEEYGQERLDAEWLWVLDPIDGTKAFVAGKPQFATLIALLHHGLPVLGVIDQPILAERWIGGVGVPAALNSKTTKTSSCQTLARARFNTTSPRLFTGAAVTAYERLAQNCQQTTFGGDAYGYALLASGHIDVILENQLKLHDFAALIPVIHAAGGVVTDWAGQPLTRASVGDVLATANPALHQAALNLINR